MAENFLGRVFDAVASTNPGFVDQKRLLLEQAQIKLNQRRQQEREQDLNLRAGIAIMNNPAFAMSSRRQAGQGILKSFGIDGDISEDGLAPLASVLKQADEIRTKGGDFSVIAPQLKMLLQDGSIIQRAQPENLTKAFGLANEIGQQQATQQADATTQILFPTDQTFQQQAARKEEELQRLQPEIAVLQSNIQSIQEALEDEELASGARVSARRSIDDKQMQLRAINRLQGEVFRNRGILAQQARFRQFARFNPDAAAKLAEGAITRELGLTGKPLTFQEANDQLFFTLTSKDPSTLTQEQKRFVETYISVKSNDFTGTKENLRKAKTDLLQAKIKGMDVRLAEVGEAFAFDRTARQAEQNLGVTKALSELEALGQQTSLTPEQVRTVQQQGGALQQTLQGFSQQLKANADQRAAKLEEQNKALTQELETVQQRVTVSTGPERLDLEREQRSLQRKIQMNEDMVLLMSTYNPAVRLTNRTSLSLLQAERASLKRGLKGNLSKEEKAQLKEEQVTNDQEIAVLEEKIRQYDTGRAGVVQRLQLQQLRLTQDSKKLSAQHVKAQLRDKQVSLINQAMSRVNELIENGTPPVKALQAAVQEFPTVDQTKVRASLSAQLNMSSERAINDGQLQLGGAIQEFSQNGKRTPTKLQIATMATNIAKAIKEDQGITVSPQALMKDLKVQESQLKVQVGLPKTVQSKAIQALQARNDALDLIDNLADLIEQNPTAVGVTGVIRSFVGSSSQQLQAALGQNPSVAPFFNTQPEDEVEAFGEILVFNVARALNGSGRLTEQDVTNARKVVGSLKGAGPNQVLNKLSATARFLRKQGRRTENLLKEGIQSLEATESAQETQQSIKD
ncbi:MAG: hypothetical protein ACR2NF_05740, partial [Pirellulales bacterium]